MKRAFGLLVAVAALAIGTGSAMATPPPPGNSSQQSATLGQNAQSSATAANAGSASDTTAVAVAANHAGISQFAGQAADDGNNTSSQTAGVQQGAGAVAVAVNTGSFNADTSAVAVAKNGAFVDQDAFQLALWGTANTSSQYVSGSQVAGAAAVAGNTASCTDTDAFAGSFNHGWINQLAVQLAFP